MKTILILLAAVSLVLIISCPIYAGMDFRIDRISSPLQQRVTALEKFYFESRKLPTFKELEWYFDWIIKAIVADKRPDMIEKAIEMRDKAKEHFITKEDMRAFIDEMRSIGAVIKTGSVPCGDKQDSHDKR